MKIKSLNKKLAKKFTTIVCMVSLFFVSDFVFASNESIVLDNNIANQAPGNAVFSITSEIASEAGHTAEIAITIPDLFMSDNINGPGDNHLWDHCSLEINTTPSSLVEDDVSTYLSAKELHFTANSSFDVGDELVISCDSTVIDVNPYIADNYEFNFIITDTDDSDTFSAIYSLIIMPGAGDLFSDLELSNSSVLAENVEMDFDIILGSDFPSGSHIVVHFPADFVMDNIADIIPNITSFTVNETNIQSNITSASLLNNVLNIELNSSIDAGDVINLAFDSTVLDTNPSSPGQYTISTLTRDTSDVLIDAGIGYVNIDNRVNVVVTVQEALIMTLDSNIVNISVDPSVNNGEDYSQSTKIEVSTNAIGGYKILGQLLDSEDNATLKSPDSTILPGDPEVDENVFGYIAYNDDVNKTKEELQADANPVSVFSNTSEVLDLYDGTIDAVGYSTNTNMQIHTIYYGLNINFLTPAGIYSGIIYYTALPTF